MGYLFNYGEGSYGDPGYGVLQSSQAPASDPYLSSLYGYGSPTDPGYGVLANGDPSGGGLSLGDIPGLVKGGLSGLGRILQGVLPGLLGAANVAQQGMNRPRVPGVSPDTGTGQAKPIDVSAGGGVNVDPLSNYLKLIQGLR